jgi:glycosyltransferase involved in cell wall biosynthesis
MKTTLFVLTYNEIEGMKAIMPRIKKEWVNEIIVVVDGSTYSRI